jgi:hypothetical protein
MEAKGIRLQGELGISRQTIAQGMPVCPGCTCMLVCASTTYIAHETAGAASTRHSLLPPISKEGTSSCKPRTQTAPREGEIMFQMSPASLRAQRSNPWRGKKGRMDCFAEPVIRRRFAPTGWLAMTGRDGCDATATFGAATATGPDIPAPSLRPLMSPPASCPGCRSGPRRRAPA